MGTSDNAYRMLIDSGFLRQNGEFFDAYKILNISRDASEEEIEDVFKVLEKIYEPKVNSLASEKLIKDIYLAHTILTEHRQTYDIEYNKRNKQAENLKAFYKDGKFVDFYGILGVTKDATDGELRAAYKRILEENRAMYSDTNDETQNKEQKIKEAQIALEILLDDLELRASYDEEYSKQQMTNSANGGAKSTFEMSFEELMGIDFSSSRRQDEKEKEEKKDLKMGENDMNSEFYIDREFIDLYGTLGIESTSTKEEISAALEELFKKTNSNFTEDKSSDALMVLDFTLIANKVDAILLHDEETRKRYDAEYAKVNSGIDDSNGKMTQEEIESLLAGTPEAPAHEPSLETAQGQTTKIPESNPETDVSFYNENGELRDFYAIFSLDQFATTEEIKLAFDTLVGNLAVKETDSKETTTAKQNNLISAANAYEVLTKKRSEYDAEYSKKQAKSNHKDEDIIYTRLVLNNIENVSEVDFYSEGKNLVDFYFILGIPKDATREEIETAYKNKVKENIVYYNDTQDTIRSKQSVLTYIRTAYLVLTKLKDKYDQLINPTKKYPRYQRKDNDIHNILSQSEIDDLIADMKDEANMQAAQTSPEPNSITETNFYTKSGELINFYAILGVSPYSTDEEVKNAIENLKKKYQILESDSEEEKTKKTEMQKYLRLAASILFEPLVVEYDNRLIEKINKNVAEIEVTESDFYYNKLGELNDFYKLLGIAKDSDEETIVEAFTNKYTEFSINPTDDVDIRVLKALNFNLIIKGYKILTGNLRDVYDSKYEEANKKEEKEQKNMERERIEKELASLRVTKANYWTNGSFNDFYNGLSIVREATLDDIKDAFERKINKIEITQSDTPEQQAEKIESQRQLMIAYKVLAGNLKGEYDAIYDTFKEIYEEFEGFDISMDDLYDGVYLRRLYNELRIPEDSSPEEITQAFEREIYIQVITVEDEALKNSNKTRLMQAYVVLINEELKNSYLVLIKAENDMIKYINDNINTLRQTITENDFYDNGKYGDGSLKNLYALLDVFKDVSPIELEDALVKKFKEVLVYSEDDEMTRNKKHTEQTELLKAYVILSGSLKTAYDEEFDRVFNKGGAGMGTGTDEEKRYEEAEAKAREAFNTAQKARLAALKAKLEAEAEKLKAASEEAAKAAEAAKEAQDAAKDSLKDAKEAANELKKKAKEASKEAKKKKREEKKALRKAKKAEKDAEKKLKKSEKKRTVLIRERMGGRLLAPIRAIGRHWKKIVAGATATAVVAGSGFGIYTFVTNRQNKNDDDIMDKPHYSETHRRNYRADEYQHGSNNSTMDDEELEDAVRIVHENWTDLGLGYTKEEITELVNNVQNRDSQIDVDTADEMMNEAINASLMPALNNIISGEKVFKVSAVDLSTLLSEKDAAIDAVCNMEDYLNAMLTGTDNIKVVAREALEDEVRVIVLGETVDGFNMNTSSPTARLIWTRLANGINVLAGTLGEDFAIEVDGTTYTQKDIGNSTTFQIIINRAKAEMGSEAKTLSMNNNN